MSKKYEVALIREVGMGGQGLYRCSEIIPFKTLNISTQVCHVLQKCVVPKRTSQSGIRVVNTHTHTHTHTHSVV